MAAPVNRFKQSLKEGRQTIGCWLTQGTAIAAEIAATADFDWLLIDTEHSPNNLPSVLAQLQAIAGYDASAAVRPHVGETHVIKQILDMGCQTLIVPMVESGEQAEMLVRSMRYPPAGIRGVGGAGARATGFSSHADYLTTADREMCLVVQIETPAGVAALDDILAVEGVDAVFIGPSDLSANYGHIGNPGAPEVVEAVQSSLDKIAASDKASGIMALDPAAANPISTAVSILSPCRSMRARWRSASGPLPPICGTADPRLNDLRSGKAQPVRHFARGRWLACRAGECDLSVVTGTDGEHRGDCLVQTRPSCRGSRTACQGCGERSCDPSLYPRARIVAPARHVAPPLRIHWRVPVRT